MELNEDGQRLMKVQQERLGRSLDRLSKDLYSKDTHFVLGKLGLGGGRGMALGGNVVWDGVWTNFEFFLEFYRNYLETDFHYSGMKCQYESLFGFAELIQNADDNSYPDDLGEGDCPSVKFLMRQDGVIVLNNECGFRDKDIKALCDVGRSTKGKHKAGYIGTCTGLKDVLYTGVVLIHVIFAL